jgi:hypothetical protein
MAVRSSRKKARITELIFFGIAIPVIILGGMYLPTAGFAVVCCLVFGVEFAVLRWLGSVRD